MSQDPDVVIDADEFATAQRDPRLFALHEEAKAYARQLVERGHCPDCLVVNCECGEIPAEEA